MAQDTLDKDTIFFIHNVFGNFFANTLDYFSDILYDRVNFKVVSTYDKAVEYCNKKGLLGREADKPLLPALVLNPTGTMMPADANAGGRQLWRYPNLAAGLGAKMFDPIYKDANMQISPVFMRFKGEIELIYLVNSFYEYLDLKVHLLNHLGGLDRIIYPDFFTSFLIIPEDFVTYTYSNEYTGLHYKLNWGSAQASTQLIRSTAQNELVLPLHIKPQFAMTDLSDGSTRYGGTDTIADWRLTATINYEVEIPTYMVINSDYLVQNINMEMRFGSVYTKYQDFSVPENRIQLLCGEYDWGYDETSNSTASFTQIDSTSDEKFDLIHNRTYLHQVSAGEADATANWTITIPAPDSVGNKEFLMINSYNGNLSYGDHYLLGGSGRIVTIKYQNVSFSEGDWLELHIYNPIE